MPRSEDSASIRGMDDEPRQTHLRAGHFIVAWLRERERQGGRSVYLRNYERLPDDIGNDVDLLIERGTTAAWIESAKEAAPRFGWRFLRAVPFGCTSLFFFRPDADEILHVDLNERIEWHCVPFADEAAVLSRRRWNGTVFVPAPEDELFLNVATRLIYQGAVREKHRAQWNELRPTCSTDGLDAAFARLGPSLGRRIVTAADEGDWASVEALQGHVRRHSFRQAVLRHSGRFATSAFRYVARTVRRLASPPGFVFSFAVDPSIEAPAETALQLAAPRLAKWGNLSECRLEHGKKPSNGWSRRTFLARNGVIARFVLAPGDESVSSAHGMSIRIPESDGPETPESLAGRMVRAARERMIADREENDR